MHHVAEQDRVDDVLIVGDETRPAGDVVHGEGCKQHGGAAAARQAEGQQRCHRAAFGTAVGGFGGNDAVGISFAEAVRIIRDAAGVGIGNQIGDGSSHPRNGADEDADHGAAQQRLPVFSNLCEALKNTREADDAVFLLLDDVAGARQIEELGGRQKADHRGHDRDAVQQLGKSERAAHLASRPDADGADHQAEDAGEDSALEIAPAQRGDHGDTPDRHHSHLERTELQNRPRGVVDEQEEHQIADESPDGRSSKTQPECLVVVPLACHREPSEGCGVRRRGAGRVDQDGRYRAAEAGAGEHRGEKHHRGEEVHVEREGQHQCDDHGARNAGQCSAGQAGKKPRDDDRPRHPRSAENIESLAYCSKIDEIHDYSPGMMVVGAGERAPYIRSQVIASPNGMEKPARTSGRFSP